jgi:hypothetical protein
MATIARPGSDRCLAYYHSWRSARATAEGPTMRNWISSDKPEMTRAAPDGPHMTSVSRNASCGPKIQSQTRVASPADNMRLRWPFVPDRADAKRPIILADQAANEIPGGRPCFGCKAAHQNAATLCRQARLSPNLASRSALNRDSSHPGNGQRVGLGCDSRL